VRGEKGGGGDVFAEMDRRKCDLLRNSKDCVDRETEHGSRDSGSAEESKVEGGCRDAHRCGSDASCDGKLEKTVSWVKT